MDKKETILLRDVLSWLDSGRVFQSIAFVTCDRKKGTGGELITIQQGRKHDFLSAREQKQLARSQPVTKVLRKHPRHYENSTRNIFILKNSEIRKVHIRLIRKFNGKTVL